MKIPQTLLLIVTVGLNLQACDKSPKELYEQLTAKKVKRTIVVNEPQTDGATRSETPPQGQDDSTAQLPSEQRIEDKSTIGAVVDAVSRPPVSEQAPYQMCHALLKTMQTEPYFYQFQANLREYRMKEQHGELVRGHVKFHNIDFAKSVDQEPYRECADIVSSFDRYQDVKVLWSQPYWDVHKSLDQHLLAFRSGRNYYPIERCAEVIASLSDDSEFAALLNELSRSSHDSLSPEVMMGSMMEAGEITAKEETAMITPKGCIKALKSFASFAEVQQFASSDNREQRERLGIHSSAIVAH